MVPLQYMVSATDIPAALSVGVHWLQLDAPDSFLGESCAQLLQLAHDAGSYLVLTDAPEICKDTAADGLLLTLDGIAVLTDALPEPTGIVLQWPRPITLAIAEARRILGEESPQFVGVVATTPDDAVAAAKAGADFIQVPQPLCPTLLQAVRQRSFTTPIVALDVCEADAIPHLLDAGVSGIACTMAHVPPIMIPLFLNADEQ